MTRGTKVAKQKKHGVKQSVPQMPGGSRYIEVPWRSLRVSPTTNARAGEHAPEGIAELAALIASVGLTTPLLVRDATGNGAWEILDGSRRHAAIGRLIEQGQWPADRDVPCYEANVDAAGGLEASLVSNIAREPMHPVRELEVFAELHGAGADVGTIAQRYGVSARVVRQRLALGGLAPEILSAWRAGQIDAATAQAFAACRDANRQAKVFAELKKSNRLWTHEVRQHLVKDKPRLNDPRIEFIGGLDAYRAAGGKVVESLFKDDGHLENGELLERLVSERIAAKCAELKVQGWSFALPVSEVKGEAHWSWQKLQPGKVTYTAEETARLAALGEEEKELEAVDSLDDEQIARADAIVDECQRIEAEAKSRAYTKAQKAKSGCIVDGDTIMYGLVRPKSAKAAVATKTGQEGHQGEDDAGESTIDADQDEGETEARISNSLMMSISEKQTLAAAKALAASPAVALMLAVAGLRSYSNAPIKITAAGYHGPGGVIDDTGYGEFTETLAALDGKDLTVELARALSRTLDLRRYAANDHAFGHKCDTPGIAALVSALPGETYLAEMRAEFDADDYFRRSPAAMIRVAIAEMTRGKRALGDKVKKADLVEIATALAGPTGWLPAELRHPDYRLTIDQEPDAAAAPAKGRKRKAKAA